MENKIEELKLLITKYDSAYRIGNSIIPDESYDLLIEELKTLIGTDNEFFKSSIYSDDDDIDSSRKVDAPIKIKSISKIKTICNTDKKTNVSDGVKWMKSNNIPLDTELILLPKYDGNNLLTEQLTRKAYSKGRTTQATKMDDHLAIIDRVIISEAKYSVGEIIISKENFIKLNADLIEQGKKTYKTPLSAIGLLRNDDPLPETKYLDYVKYNLIEHKFTTKSDIIDYINQYQEYKVPYKIYKFSDLSNELMLEIYKEFSNIYNLDGIIIEVNNTDLFDKLGVEKSTENPNGCVAYKGEFEEVKETTIIDIEYSISKNGNIYPVGIIEPTLLDGATVNRVTIHNCGLMKILGAGVGAKIKIKRSGSVIPYLISVVERVDFKYPEDIPCHWDDNYTHLVSNFETDEMLIAKNLAFLQILKVDVVSEKSVEQLFYAGYKTVKDILTMSIDDFKNLDGYQDAKAIKSYEAIQSKLQNIPLSTLQHASNCFPGLGSKKLVLLEHIEKPTLDDILKVDGFAETSAMVYLNNIDKFNEFIKDLPITIGKKEKIEILSNDLQDQSFVFSGFRNQNAELAIEQRGGTIGSGVSKKTTYLVVKDITKRSSKMEKAEQLGVKIIDENDLQLMGLII